MQLMRHVKCKMLQYALHISIWLAVHIEQYQDYYIQVYILGTLRPMILYVSWWWFFKERNMLQYAYYSRSVISPNVTY